MVDPSLEHQGLGLSGRDLALTLFGKYIILAIYGAWAAVVELPTFVLVGSHLFAALWGTAICLLASVALFGIARTWATGRYRLEKWTTAAFILVFVGYSFAIIWRCVITDDWDSGPTALIPVAVCVLPTIRFYSLMIHGRDGHARGVYREVGGE